MAVYINIAILSFWPFSAFELFASDVSAAIGAAQKNSAI
jgi:hypothetical protein